MDRLTEAVTRRWLALVIVVAVVCIAGVAIPVPAAMAVFDKLLPVLTLVLGFYFGENAHRH